MSIEEEVIDVIAEQLGVDAGEISVDSSFVEDLNADSLDQTEMLMSLEERFSCEIDEAAAEKMKTVADVISFVKENTKG